MKSASRPGAPGCCLLAAAGALLFALLPLPPTVTAALCYSCFYVLPVRRGLWGARCALPLWRQGCGGFVCLAALTALFGAPGLCLLTEKWCAWLARSGVSVSAAAAPRTPGAATALLLSACAFPAFAEEYLLRGALLPAAAKRPIPAVAYTAAVFALLHGVGALPASLLAGAVLGFLALRCGCLLPAMAYHFCHNAAVLALGCAAAQGAALPPGVACAFLLPFCAGLFALQRLRRAQSPLTGEASPALCFALLCVLALRLVLLR